MNVSRVSNDVKDLACQFHSAEGMLEPLMRSAWIYKIRKS